MKNLNLKILLSLCIIASALAFTNAYSQANNNKPVGISTTEMISNPVPDPQISEVTRNIKLAKKNGDMKSKSYWENRLNELTHPQIIKENTTKMLIGKTENTVVADPEKVLNVSRLTSSVIIGNSVSRERVHGDIYAAIGFYGEANTDTLRIYRSTNNGISFTNIYTIYSSQPLKMDYNSLDVEAVSKGDSSFAFVSLSYHYSSLYYSSILRVRQDGLQAGEVDFDATVAKKYINPRVTSDNASYTTGAYVYFSAVLDSVVAGARNLRSKMGVIKNPFATNMELTMAYQDNVYGAYAYLVLDPAGVNATFETDVAFVNNGGDSDQVYTCTIVNGVTGAFGDGTSLHFTRSSNYGATAPGLFLTSDPDHVKFSPRIAASGDLNNTLMVVTRRLFNNGDYDPYYFYTSNVNFPTPAFTSNYVNSTADTTAGVSVGANYKSNGTYLFAYNNRTGPNSSKIYSTPFRAGVLGLEVQVNPAGFQGTNIYGTPDATFRNVNNDSCFVIWGGTAGNGSYVTGGCSGTFTSVGNPNTVIKDFRLDQNYPNPFNPTTNISYNLPVSGLVKIVVYDVLGSEVATVLNENKQAGYYSSVFDGKNLASGAYYYKITFTSSDNNSFSQTRKMMLIK